MRRERQHAHAVLKDGYGEEAFSRGVEMELFRLLASRRKEPEGAVRAAAHLSCIVEVPDDDVFRDFDFEATAPDGYAHLGWALYEAFEQPFLWCCDSFEGPCGHAEERP